MSKRKRSHFFFVVSFSYYPIRSMLPDVVDQAALERGIRREELFYAFFVFGNKFAGGVTLGISTGVYKYVCRVTT